MSHPQSRLELIRERHRLIRERAARELEADEKEVSDAAQETPREPPVPLHEQKHSA